MRDEPVLSVDTTFTNKNREMPKEHPMIPQAQPTFSIPPLM